MRKRKMGDLDGLEKPKTGVLGDWGVMGRDEITLFE